MMIKRKEIILNTKGDTDILDVTDEISTFIKDSKIRDGVVSIFVKGSTAAVTSIEYEPGLLKDFKNFLKETVPQNKNYFHDSSHSNGNAFSHLKASLIGPSIVIPLILGNLELGTWQQIVLVDFDIRPRERSLVVNIIGE